MNSYSELQRAMAAEDEAARNARAKVITAEGEHTASRSIRLQVCFYPSEIKPRLEHIEISL